MKVQVHPHAALAAALACFLAAACTSRNERTGLPDGAPPSESLATLRAQSNSDDAFSVEEAGAHGKARALVIQYVQPNDLRVGGAEFRVKRHPDGAGAFVYDPRTKFAGVTRNLIWWVSKEGKAYPLNGPSKAVTPALPWAREEGVTGPSTTDAIAYVFRGEPMPLAKAAESQPEDEGAEARRSFTVDEYRIYRYLMDAPASRSEDDVRQELASRHGMSSSEIAAVINRVQRALYENGWMSSPQSEIRHASDWNGETK